MKIWALEKVLKKWNITEEQLKKVIYTATPTEYTATVQDDYSDVFDSQSIAGSSHINNLRLEINNDHSGLNVGQGIRPPMTPQNNQFANRELIDTKDIIDAEKAFDKIATPSPGPKESARKYET